MCPLGGWHGEPGLDRWLEENSELFGIGEKPGAAE